jgi:hypothetical protein
MDEPLPGLWHWTAVHPNLGIPVHSHYLPAARTVFDPLVPDEGLEFFEQHGPPERVVLSNRHHLRHAERFADAFACELLCNRAGLHEFEDGGLSVRGFAPGDELAPGVEARELGVICPDDTAIHLAVGPGALLFADAVIRAGRDEDGGLTFVPDRYIGDDHNGVKRGVRLACARLAQADDFDALLFAHGHPLAEGGRRALIAFARAG